MEKRQEIKNNLESELYQIVQRCHQKDISDNFEKEMEEIHLLFDSVKESLQDMEDDFCLYKYREYDDNSKNILKNSWLYKSTPTKFDDVFDARIMLDLEKIDNSNMATYLEALYCSLQIEKANKNEDINGWWDIFANINDEIDDTVRILSFSECNNLIPLWFYYANQHNGICLEYSVKEIVKSLKENEYLMPVIYTENYFKYNPAIMNNDIGIKRSIQANALIKHKSWEFEKEWRIIQINDGKISEFTNKIPIKSIILGKNVKKNVEEEIKEMAKATPIHYANVNCFGFGIYDSRPCKIMKNF